MSFLRCQKQSPEFLNNYLKYLGFILSYTKTTIDTTYYDLTVFFRYIKLKFHNETILNNITIEKFKEITISDITLADMNKVTSATIIDFIYFCNYTLNNEAKTRNKKLASVKGLFRYLETNNLIARNPVQEMKSAKIEKRLPKYLNINESKQLLSKTITSNMRYKIRNYTITCLFLNCGIRLSELIHIDIDDIKLDEQTIKIYGKGNKERIIYLDEACCEAITEYLKIRPNIKKDNIDYDALFISSQNKRISKRTVQTIIDEEMKMAFNEDKNRMHTHTLRHSSASLMYNINDTDILILKKILGHSSIAATEIYTHIDSKKLKYIMQNCAVSNLIENKLEEK